MSSDSIRVVCRLRPLNKIQIANQGQECVTYSNKDITIAIGGQQNKYNFAFDKVFGPSTRQVEIYQQVAVPVIKAVISGFNGTIFAYGQTGGGKTWTMEGSNHHDAEFKGLIPRTIQGLFQAISEGDQNLQFVIKCSYIQIYNQKLFDLLDPSKSRLQIKEDKHKGVYIQNCTQINVATAEQMLKTMDNGAQNRKVAFTGMNERSSRSHSLFTIYVYQKNVKKDNTKQSKLYFVDLAGSEKVSKTGCQGVQLEEAKNINKSLSCLGNVINALTSQKKQHIPYRDSKLTRVLQQSLGGNSKTTLIINCSMCTYNDKETLSTLRFGYRAKSIKNKAKVNEQKSAKELLLLLQAASKTIADLKLQLGGKMPVSLQQGQNTSTTEQNIAIIEQLKQRIQGYKRQQQEKTKQLKEMQLRIKSVLLELSQTKQQFSLHTDTCKAIFNNLKAILTKINKYMSRVYIDLQYWINNLIIQGTQQNQEIKQNLDKTFQNIMEFTSYYNKQVKNFFNEDNSSQNQPVKQEISQVSSKNDRSFSKKIKVTYSEPNLIGSSPYLNQQLQMSCISDKRNQHQEDNSNINSEKVSQEESFTQIETFLESLETKESQRMAIQQISYKLKTMSKQNEELVSKNQKLIIQNKIIAHKVQERFFQKLLDLEERVDQYRYIIKQKDLEITNFSKQFEKLKKLSINEKVVCQRLKKVIQGNNNLKSYYQMQEKLRSLASQRQNLFNQLYNLRNQLDDAELTIKQKQEHIQSLKNVMKQLSTNSQEETVPLKKQEIAKKYNKQVYGTQTPNVVITIKGGSKNVQANPNSIPSRQRQSSLRKKVTMNKSRQDKGSILPYIKGFFSQNDHRFKQTFITINKTYNVAVSFYLLFLMIKQKETSPVQGRQYECETRRQHFNHLRNTSVNMRNCLAWDISQPSINDQRFQEQIEVNLPKGSKQELEASAKQNRKVSFDAKQNVEHIANNSRLNDASNSTKKVEKSQNKGVNVKQKSKSTRIESKKTKQDNQDAEIRRQIRQKQLEMQAAKQQQRREKVQKYVQDLKPYTRSLTNTKYQDYFNKAAFESYGRVNVKNAIGGIIYGNHQKTFNMNPHIRGNEPKYYQTHYTSINYGKRTKLNEEDKWNRLQKELSKKLGLKDKNQSLKQGKEVVYVDVDDSNMHSVMKENLKFKKEHEQEIHGLEKEYQKEVQAEKKTAVQAFYAQKRDRILTGNTIDSQQSTYVCDRDQKGRLQEQVVYRHTDKDGNVRLGADRHALTCFVDLNFPENDAAYTKELCNRLQIYPIQVENKDKYIDDQRRENYQKSLQNIYPSHYLMPNCDQPQVLKMINNKYGKVQKQKEIQNRSKRMGSTFATTGVPNVSSLSAKE